MIGLARRKRQFQQQYPTYFYCNKDLSRAMLPIYYGTSFLTFCQNSGLKEAFENIIIKYQTALKFEFQEHASDWPEDFSYPPTFMLIFPATEICAELCCQSTWGHLPQLSAKFEPWMKHLSVFDMKQQYILKLILLWVSLLGYHFVQYRYHFMNILLRCRFVVICCISVLMLR